MDDKTSDRYLNNHIGIFNYHTYLIHFINIFTYLVYLRIYFV